MEAPRSMPNSTFIRVSDSTLAFDESLKRPSPVGSYPGGPRHRLALSSIDF
jgi:hypothetical protein